MIKKSLLVILTMSLFLSFRAFAVEEQKAQVEMSVSEPTVFEDSIAIDVTTVFNDMTLYNENVLLSFHLLDENGESLQFENERYPLVMDGNQSWQTVMLSKENCPADWEDKSLQIQFDLVDEKHSFWFSNNTAVAFHGATSVINFSSELGIANPVEENQNIESEKAPLFSVVVNVIGIAGIVISIMWAKKKNTTTK